MIIMKGKYNSANIMIDEIDDTTKEQIQVMLNHPAFANSYIAIMPDTHAGAGAVIGLTMKGNNYIIPNIVGVDIGCGVLSAKFNIAPPNLEKLDNFIIENIPSGFNIRNTSKVSQYLNRTNQHNLQIWAETVGSDYTKVKNSIGTLGGGNHFIEAGLDSEDKLWITIHTGSRNFGLKVANYFQKIAKQNMEKYFIGDIYKSLEFLIAEETDGLDYLDAMECATKLAVLNREAILRDIVTFLGNTPVRVIESIHNFIGSDNIIRKGAIAAYEDQEVVIPFNMKDGLAIGVGKGNKKWNFSAPHGAGRILSRKKAKESLDLAKFIKGMDEAGIFTTTATAKTLDEAPNAYKDKETILNCIKETVEVIDFIRPIYNFKATS